MLLGGVGGVVVCCCCSWLVFGVVGCSLVHWLLSGSCVIVVVIPVAVWVERTQAVVCGQCTKASTRIPKSAHEGWIVSKKIVVKSCVPIW